MVILPAYVVQILQLVPYLIEEIKTDIVDLEVGLDFINSLLPRQFKWQTREGSTKDGTVRAGFYCTGITRSTKRIRIFRLSYGRKPR